MKKISLTILLVIQMMLTSCGGGGGGNSSNSATPAQQPTRAIVKLSTIGPANIQIGGVDVTMVLPTGVTIKSKNSPPETDAGTVVASGQAAVNSLAMATYTAGSPGKMHIVIVNSGQNGFTIGEFATITCDLASGANPTSSDFTIQSSIVGDLNGAAALGVSVNAGVVLE